MDVLKIRDGLWRWSAPHPGWTPDCDRPNGWARMVGSVYAEFDDAVVLIDPMIPGETADRDRFWQALDRDVARRPGPVLILVGCVDHGRSADHVAARYRGRGREVLVVGDAAIGERVSCRLDRSFDDAAMPKGLVSLPIAGLSPGERAFVLEPWRAAVFADAVIGAGKGQVRVAPGSWGVRTADGQARYVREFRPAVGRVASARPEILLPSHGEPVLTGGAAALDAALSAPSWGE